MWQLKPKQMIIQLGQIEFVEGVIGLAVGLEEKGTDNHMSQYETNYCIPKMDMLEQLAAVMRVNPLNFYSDIPGCTRISRKFVIILESKNWSSNGDLKRRKNRWTQNNWAILSHIVG